MPQLIAMALIGILVFYAWRALRREMDRIGNEVDESERVKSQSQSPAQLEKGPDGVYRPKRD